MSGSPTIRHGLVAALCLGAVYHTAPWPWLQAGFHACLVLGLAPEFRSRLVAVLWSAAAGWVLEGTLRMVPHLGGQALANMVATLAVAWSLSQWPPTGARALWLRLAGFSLAHALLGHACVRLAAGPHAWGWGWLTAVLTAPLWGTLAFRLFRPFHRR